MAGSLKTTNYDLSKYAPNDVTSWLVDFNGNMDKIDAQMKANADANVGTEGNVASLAQKMTAAEEKIATMQESITVLEDDIVVSKVLFTASANTNTVYNQGYEVLGIVNAILSMNIGKTGTELSSIPLGKGNNFIPLVISNKNIFSLTEVTRPTDVTLEYIGLRILNATRNSNNADQKGNAYAYWNGTSTLIGMILADKDLIAGNTFNNVAVFIQHANI